MAISAALTTRNEREIAAHPPYQHATAGALGSRSRAGRLMAWQLRFGHLTSSGENWDPATYGPTFGGHGVPAMCLCDGVIWVRPPVR